MNVIEILILVLSVAVLIALYYLFFYEDSPLKKKSGGKDLPAEKQAAQALRTANGYARSHGGKVLAPALIAKDGKFAEADFIIVGYYGVTAVKCIPMGGEIYGTAQDETWLQVLGGQRKSVPNPLLGLEAGARLVRDTLFTAKLKNVPVEMIAVFTNPKATIAVGKSAGYFTLKTFKQLLRKDKYLQDKNVDVDATLAAIRQWVQA